MRRISPPPPANRIAVEPLTLPLAELLLTKMQIVQMNEMDVRDLAEMKLTVVERLNVLRAALDDSPKSLKWKARAAVGELTLWYELPEEVKRG